MHTCVCQMNMISHNVNRNRDVGGGGDMLYLGCMICWLGLHIVS